MSWFGSVDSTSLFDAARTTATLLAVIGVGGAALVTYRRQDTAERTHEVAFRSEVTTAKQLELDSQKYQLDRDRHELDVQRRKDERERELRTRFTTVAEQLGSANFAVRHAGAYALASLADDWHRFGNDGERQVCVNLLCAQIRSTSGSDGSDGSAVTAQQKSHASQNIEVGKTLIALLRSRRPVKGDGLSDWNSCTLDLSGADLSGLQLDEIDLQGANLDDVDLSFTTMSRANLSDARVRGAKLTGAEFHFCQMKKIYMRNTQVDQSHDRYAAVELGGNDLTGADFGNATLGNAQFVRSDLTDAKFSGAHLEGSNFHNAILARAWFYNAKLGGADFRQTDIRGTQFGRRRAKNRGGSFSDRVDLMNTDFSGATADESTIWPGGIPPDTLIPPPPDLPPEEQ